MKFPANIDIMLIIQHALYMIAPDRYAVPPGIATNSSVSSLAARLRYSRKSRNARAASKYPNSLDQRAATLPRHTHSSNGNSASSTSRSDRNRSPGGATRGTVESGSRSRAGSFHSSDGMQERISSIQSKTAKSTVRMASQAHPAGQDPGIVDGYVENVS